MLSSERYLLRPATRDDLESFYYLATNAGTGMTNLPSDKAILKEKIDNSIESFIKNPKSPGNESYLFMLEQAQKHKVIGCCAIYASIGNDPAFYSFRILRETTKHNDLESQPATLFLQLVNDYVDVTEIGSLFLLPRFRKHRLGEFLSRARYLFMAQYPDRFHQTVIAEMRGYSDQMGRSPFWNALGHRFIKSTFKEADQLTAAHYNEFIGELLPHTPIPVALLDEAAQACVGRPHEATRAAVHLLETEGFEFSHYVDVFDGGPTFEAKMRHIRSVKNMQTRVVTAIQAELKGTMYLCANQGLDFRATLGACEISDKQFVITTGMAEDLKLKIGDSVNFVLF